MLLYIILFFKGGLGVASTNINIRTSIETKTRAQEIFASLGLDMTTAINLFLLQTVRVNDFPFVISTNPERQPVIGKLAHGRGCMKGKIWLSEDFDAPLDDMKEYME